MFRWLRELQCFVAGLVTDDSGRPSLAKGNLLIGATLGGVIVMKEAMYNPIRIEVFSLYLLFCSGHLLGSKFLDMKGGANADSKGN